VSLEWIYTSGGLEWLAYVAHPSGKDYDCESGQHFTLHMPPNDAACTCNAGSSNLVVDPKILCPAGKCVWIDKSRLNKDDNIYIYTHGPRIWHFMS
jgi:hypothetical protein